MSLRDQSIVLTGASEGIGRGLAIALAAQGANLTLAARNREALEETARRCELAGGKALVVPTDVGDAEATRALIDAAVARFGGIDMLVNNAGVSMWARFDEVTDLTVFERIMRVNYLGAVYCTHHALPHLKKRRGLIVAVSSLTGKTGVPTRSGYAASKHAMQGFFDSLRIELRDSGVSVLVVSPGFVKTDIRAHALGPDGKSRAESPREEDDGDTMSLDECVALTMRGIQRRDREVVMTTRAKLAQWVKLVAPGVVDRIAERALREKRRP
jgi:NAD(P)-dependent dehydrogenase (short-subunit alcohol dehydrogenase family)